MSSGQVRVLERPPVRQSITVRAGQEHTFWIFIRTIGVWWPVTPFSAGQEQVRDVTFEERAGGRVYETWADGTEADWGEVLIWEPTARFVMTWLMTKAKTEVELSFTALGPSLTRVSVEHRGWERLTDEQLSAACALPGGYAGGAFGKGWAMILGRLAHACGDVTDGDLCFHCRALPGRRAARRGLRQYAADGRDAGWSNRVA